MNARRPRGGCSVNEAIPAPKSPGPWVDEERCVCGATYTDHRTWPDWMEATDMVRRANGGWHAGGGYRTRGPVLWAMHVLKLTDWYEKHYFCGALTCEDEPSPVLCTQCNPVCPWCE